MSKKEHKKRVAKRKQKLNEAKNTNRHNFRNALRIAPIAAIIQDKINHEE